MMCSVLRFPCGTGWSRRHCETVRRDARGRGALGAHVKKSEADGSGGVEPPLRVLVRVCWRGSVTQTVLKGGSGEQGLSCRRIKKAGQAGLARPPSLTGINL